MGTMKDKLPLARGMYKVSKQNEGVKEARERESLLDKASLFIRRAASNGDTSVTIPIPYHQHLWLVKELLDMGYTVRPISVTIWGHDIKHMYAYWGARSGGIV